MKNMNKLKHFFLAIYILWVFVNVYVLVFFGGSYEKGVSGRLLGFGVTYGFDPKDEFFPFDRNWVLSWNCKYYDYSEFFIYVIGPLTVFVIYKILRKKSIE